MENNKIHIDSLFSNGLKNLQIPPTYSDIKKAKENIENLNLNSFKNAFTNYELPITDNDWLVVKERLANGQNKTSGILPVTSIADSFKDFEITVTDSDWTTTKNKLADAKNKSKKKILWWWWLNIAIIGALALLLSNPFSKSQSIANGKEQISSTTIATANAPNTANKNIPTEPTANVINETNSDIKNQTVFNNHQKINERVINSNLFETIKPKDNGLISKANKSNSNAVLSYSSIENALPNNNENANDTKTTNSDIKETVEIEDIKIEDAKIEDVKDDKKLNIDNLKKDSTPKKNEPKINPPSKPKTNYFIGLNSQIAQTFRVLPNSNNSIYNSIRNNAEKPFTQFSYGIVSGFQKGKNQIQIGGQFTQQNWTSNYNYTYRIYDSLPVRNTSGQIIGYFLTRGRDTSINESQTIIIKKIDIPFTYNYIQTLNTKNSLILGMGGVIGFNTSATGNKIINPINNQLYYYKTIQKKENNYSFSPSINIGLQRNISNYFQVQTSIYSTCSLTSRFKKNYGAKDLPYSYGLSLKLLFLLH